MGIIRFLLALSVVIYHAVPLYGFTLMNGLVAVKSFFIISGFYIAYIVTEKYTSLRSFYINRFLRIYPLYWLVFIGTVFFYYFFFYTGGKIPYDIFHSPPDHFIFYTTIKNFFRDVTLFYPPDYFNFSDYHVPVPLVGVAWTLQYEIFFYLIAPVLVPRNSTFLGVLTLASFLLRYLIIHDQRINGIFYIHVTNIFPAYLGFFLLGILMYKLSIPWKNVLTAMKNISLFLILGMLGLIFFWHLVPMMLFRWMPIKEWLFYILLTISIPIIFYSIKSPIDIFLGKLSYPLYISHTFYIGILINILPYPQASIPFTLWLVFVSVTGSVVLLQYIETPIDAIRQKIMR